MTLIRNAIVGGQRVSVRMNSMITAMAPDLTPLPDEAVIDAAGTYLLPGLHDHHLHFFALAAQRRSLDCGPQAVTAAGTLQALLNDAPGAGWLRGIHYHESVAGPLYAAQLDAWISHRPVRIQHRSGKVWMLNTAAMRAVCIDEYKALEGVECDANGEPTGRLFRMDAWLGERIDALEELDIGGLSRHLTRLGITGITDASYTNNAAQQQQLKQLCNSGAIQQKLYVMGDGSVSAGPRKIMLDEDALPPFDQLVTDLRLAHEQDRGAAFHCVSHLELVFVLAALDEAGLHPQDRIEHGGMITQEMIARLAEMNLPVITQPGFITVRGEQYREALSRSELIDLYRYRSLLQAGIQVIASSDAPYGPVDPWQVAAAAQLRLDAQGVCIGKVERVSASDALSGYFRWPHDLSLPPRQTAVGSPADLCLSHIAPEAYTEHVARLGASVLQCPTKAGVSAENAEESPICATFIDGKPVYVRADLDGAGQNEILGKKNAAEATFL